MSAVYPTRSVVIIVAVILAVLLLPPQRANAYGKGDAGAAVGALLALGAGAALDIGVGIYDIQASERNQRISKLAAGLQLALMLPQLAYGTFALSSWAGSNGRCSSPTAISLTQAAGLCARA